MSAPNYAALSASDGSGEAVRATVQSPGRSIGSTSIPVDATTNWPTGTFIATTGTLLSSGKLDPTTTQVFYGTASGTTITITAFASGYTDLGNAIGDVVVIKPTTEWANIVAQGIEGTTQFPANFQNFVEASGGVWSAGAGLVGSATAGYVWYNGTRSAMAAVSSYTFTASKDTYVDYNPSTATLAYVPVTNGAAEPAITSGSVRVALVVTGSSAITSIAQAKYNNPAPLAWKYLNSAIYTGGTVTSTGATPTLITNLTVPVTIPSGATAIRITVQLQNFYQQTGASLGNLSIYSGATSGALTTQIANIAPNIGDSSTFPVMPGSVIGLIQNPSAGSVYYSVAFSASASNARTDTSSTTPALILVEVC